ncbi:hypothetical protein JX266_014164 [Neoarthrinium moseri]|nr:hypothetical protein JX266_014164 [Neoarthrinium moseri]
MDTIKPLLSTGIAVATFLISCILLNHKILRDASSKTIPHGPSGVPILGSFPFLTRYPELTLNKWARKFGDLYSVWLGGQLFMIISSPKVAKDLMVTHGSVFSSRKEMFIKGQTILKGRGVTATPYNDTWKKHRRLVTNWLRADETAKYVLAIERESIDMIQCLYEASGNGAKFFNPQPFTGRCSLNVMLGIVFGQRTSTIHDPMMKEALRLSREFMNTTGPFSNLVDHVPMLRYFPTSIRSRGRRLHRDIVSTYGGMIKEMDERIQKGQDIRDCLAKSMLQARKQEDLDDLDITFLATSFMVGGVETTAAVMQWFCALIPSYPEIQRRAQYELDSVVGRSRLPGMEDEKSLPFCRAIIKEVQRCHNPFWLGTPHAASKDFVYQGKLIPKDTVMVLNTWTMHHDEIRHPAPFKFNPDRYLHDNLTSVQSSRQPDPYQRDHWIFGAGRRICPGMQVAEQEIWLTISRILWAFDMKPVPDHPIDLKEYDGLSGRSPMPFRILLKPRHEKVKTVLADAALDGDIAPSPH